MGNWRKKLLLNLHFFFNFFCIHIINYCLFNINNGVMNVSRKRKYKFREFRSFVLVMISVTKLKLLSSKTQPIPVCCVSQH